MRIANEVAGFTLGEADLLRKAMGKKDAEVMQAQRQKFVDGAPRHAAPARRRRPQLFDLMEPFAGYGFNKSHSTAYALLAYQTAYLKAHYPAHFMAALLTIESQNTAKLPMYLGECRELGVKVLPPDVNSSELAFTVVPEGVRFGLGAVKNVGEGAVLAILEARREDGRIRSLYHLCEQVDSRHVNRRVVESLVKAGALDSLVPGPNGAPAAAGGRPRPAVRGRGEGARSRQPQPPRPRPGPGAAVRDSRLGAPAGGGSRAPGRPAVDRGAAARGREGVARPLLERPPDRAVRGGAQGDRRAQPRRPDGERRRGGGRRRRGVARRRGGHRGHRRGRPRAEDEEGRPDVRLHARRSPRQRSRSSCSPRRSRKHGALVQTDTMVLVKGRFERDEETARILASEIVPHRDACASGRRAACASAWRCRRTTGDGRGAADLLARHKGDRRVSLEMELRRGAEPLRVKADVGGPMRVTPSAEFVADVERLCGGRRAADAAMARPADLLEFEEPLAVLLKEIEALSMLPAGDSRDREIWSSCAGAWTRCAPRSTRNLSPWQRVQLARHPNRPAMLDYVNRLFPGSPRCTATAGSPTITRSSPGMATYHGEPVLVVGHQKSGADTKREDLPQLRVREAGGLPQGDAHDEDGREVRAADHRAGGHAGRLSGHRVRGARRRRGHRLQPARDGGALASRSSWPSAARAAAGERSASRSATAC